MSKPEHVEINPSPHDDPRLKSTWYHRAWVAAGCATILITLANAINVSIQSDIFREPLLAGLAGYLFADLGTGVFHWAVDNYGDATTPIIGFIIAGFQRHHKFPELVTEIQFANRLNVAARYITCVLLPLNLICHDQPTIMAFAGIASWCILFSFQFHAWAHGTRSELPTVVVALQDVGVLPSPSHHAGHHQSYNKGYCIVNGLSNRILDGLRVFEALEMVVFITLGIRSRSWSEPKSD